ncbi:hypothetical protein [Pseudorhodoferax sp. Leaf267]|uniref:hypothetical protein n=1 Tax=Pseudorhodoferax sp. Leaf267 TaxID=1736316 RepID=UPI0006FF1614|nr:hypothetical protein [Pseudorhodoferax sp. Leaf267]KQP22013.1 hypothetical protein ASF43_24525 [Pseudorhodoferax sp. Leaf267]
MSSTPRRLWSLALAGGTAAVLIGCAPIPSDAPAPTTSTTNPAAPDTSGRPSTSAAPGPAARPDAPRVSAAGTPRDYRKDAATHLYARNAERIYAGMLPPNLYAIGVLQVDVDRNGDVTRLHWMRAPSHAPEVIKEIERTVREAAPYPRPARLGRVTYTDTWLWHRSGKFQLDTLTEGQM